MSNQEKSAWLTLSLCIVALCGFVTLFILLHDKLGTTRALMVAMSPVSIIAFAAFGPIIFRQSRRSDMVMVTGEGTTISYPYRLYLTVGILVGFIIGATILTLIILDIPQTYLTNALPLIFIFSIALMIAILAILYWKKQRASVLKAEDMNAADVFLYGPDMDERDLAIKRTARWSGFGAFWLIYVFGILGYWGWAQAHGYSKLTIDTNVLPSFVFGAFILIMLVDALVTVILYRRGGAQ